MGAAHRGPILIADITGYSRFLNESELVHAEQSLSALLELLVRQTRPPLIVSRLEGDAVFSYGLEGTVRGGQAFVESIESCYVEFRRALDLMVLNTTCRCNACANIGSLDLKFFVHYGEFVVGEAAGRAELHGRDVNLLHRLLKNTVTADTGFRAYAMYSQAAVEALDLEALTEGMARHSATYDDVGEVPAWIEDLGPVWDRARAQPSTTFEDDEVLIESAVTIGLPIDVVWSYFLDVDYRRILIGADRTELVNAREGRADSGSVYECWHGDRVTRQAIVDWRPRERVVTNDTTKLAGVTYTFPVEYLLEESPPGTVLRQRCTAPEARWLARTIMRRIYPRMSERFQRQLEAFGEAIEDAHRAVGLWPNDDPASPSP